MMSERLGGLVAGLDFKCLACGRRPGSRRLRCEYCGGVVEARYEKKWSVDKSTPSMWRYGSMLPRVERVVSLGEGYTPVRRVSGVLVKNETRNPTGSYADRGSSVLASLSRRGSVALRFQPDVALSMVYYYTEGGASVRVYVNPEEANASEIILMARLGATLDFSGGPGSGEYYDPVMLEGFKTISYELFEAGVQVEGVIVPSERGYLAYSIKRGFDELEELGVIDKPPRVVLSTLAGYKPEPPVADVFSGDVVSVSDREVLDAMVKLAENGVFVKPISATSYAVAMKMKSGRYLALLTGSELRRPRGVALVNRLPPLQARVLEALKRHGGWATAYKVWGMLGRAPSLRGVYKALESLRWRGLVEETRSVEGSRKVRLYRFKG